MSDPDDDDAADRAPTWSERVRAATERDEATGAPPLHELLPNVASPRPPLAPDAPPVAARDREPAAVATDPGPTKSGTHHPRHFKRDNLRRVLIEWGAVVIGAVVVALLIKTFVLQAFYIPSASMEPTLKKDDRVLVNKLSYRLHDINRGDVVVFERPPNQPASDIHDLIKRVVGLPGETVSARDGHVYIDGGLLDEPYVPDGIQTVFDSDPPGCETPTAGASGCKVPEGHIFVMGDNRTGSSDSRVFGPIDEDLVVGRAFLQIWPVTDISTL